MLHLKRKALTPEQEEQRRTKDFFDLILPGTIRFLTDHYIVGDSFRCVWVLREYPPSTEEQAVLAQLADRAGGDAADVPPAGGCCRNSIGSCRTQRARISSCPAARTSARRWRPRAICKTWWICWPTCGATETRFCTVRYFWSFPRPAWTHCGNCRAMCPWSCPAPS